MKPGTVVTIGTRDFVLLTVNGPLRTAAPLILKPHLGKPGDVALGACVIRVSSASIVTGQGTAFGHVGAEILAECLRWYARCTETARIVAKHAPLAAWHRQAANEKSAVR